MAESLECAVQPDQQTSSRLAGILIMTARAIE